MMICMIQWFSIQTIARVETMKAPWLRIEQHLAQSPNVQHFPAPKVLKDDTHDLRLTHAAMVEGCSGKKLENFFSAVTQLSAVAIEIAVVQFLYHMYLWISIPEK